MVVHIMHGCEEHNPSKLRDVDTLLAKYRGQELRWSIRAKRTVRKEKEENPREKNLPKVKKSSEQDFFSTFLLCF